MLRARLSVLFFFVRRCGAASAIAFGIFFLAACEQSASREPGAPDTALTFTDDLDRTITLEQPARRIVTLAPGLTEIAFAAGAGPHLVGVTTADDYPPAVDALPRFNALPVDFEAITALRPDLVLATDQVNNPRDADTFTSLDIPVIYFSFDEVADIFEAVRTVGRLAGTPGHAATAADSLAEAYEQLQARTASLDHPRVLFLIGDRTLYAFGRESYVQDLIAAAGGRSLTAPLDTRAPVLSEEFVLAQEPDVLIGAWGPAYDMGQLLDLHPTWRVLPAFQHGRVYSIDGALVLRPGPRVVQGAYLLAALLHPLHFARADTSNQPAAVP